MNRRLVKIALVGLLLAFVAGFLNNQVREVQIFFFTNPGAGVWFLKSALSIVSSSAVLLYALLIAGLAGIGRGSD